VKPLVIETETMHGNVSLQVSRDELFEKNGSPSSSIVRDLELYEMDWPPNLLAGYFRKTLAPRER
jgi:hypothetical protein